MKNLFSKSTILMVFLVSCSLFAFSQDKYTVKGNVTAAEEGTGLPGASVMIKGTSTGTASDLDGNFQIEVKKGDELICSFIGYADQTIKITGQKTVAFSLSLSSAMQLSDVVVVGYGVQKKSHLTGSVGKLENETLDQLPNSRADMALRGKVAGVQIKAITSEVGESPQIRVRGMGSISASNEPLVVVDGYPVPEGLDLVDMSNVKSVEVLKDASSAAIYGSRGANGVILITTKDGSEKPVYSLNVFTGVKSAYKLYDVLDAYEYTDMSLNERQLIENYEAAQEGREPATKTFTDREMGQRLVSDMADGSTDWQNEAMRSTATIQKYQLGVSGGKKSMKYYIGASYTSDEGLLRDNFMDRFDMQAKLSVKLNKKVEVGFRVKPSFKKVQKSSIAFSDFTRNQQWLPVYHNAATAELTGYEVGDYAYARHFKNRDFTYMDADGIEQTFNGGSLWGTSNNNPIAKMQERERIQDEYRMLTSAYVNWKIMKGLTFKSTAGAYVNYRDLYDYMGVEGHKSGENYGENYTRLMTDILSENTLNYKYETGAHFVTALLGMTYQETSYKYTNILGTNAPTDYIQTINAAPIIVADDTYTRKEAVTLTSYLGRVNYAYDNRYMLSLAVRTDGSSLFGPEKKWGWFPSASVGWNVSEEEIFESFKDYVNKFKLRVSYGVTGNNDITNYAHVNLLYPSNYALGEANGNVTAGVGQTGDVLANPEIGWEQTQEFNTGIDLAFLNDRITVGADFYYSTTDQLLLQQNVNGFTGYRQFWNNIGSVENQGMELELSGVILQNKDFSWRATANLATNKNRLLSLGGEAQFVNSGERNELYLSKVGEQSIQFYGYKMIGVWQNADELAENPHSTDDAVGGIRVADINGDGEITAADRTTLGSPFPKLNWGFSNQFKYKDFDLSFTFQGSHGAKVFVGDGYYTEARYLLKDLVDGRWFSEGTAATKPREKNGRDWMLTDYLIRDASYIALRDVLLGYSLPKTLTSKIGLKKLRVYASAQNLLYFMADDYFGLNPEAVNTSSQYSSPLVDGYQRGAYPLVRTITFGLDVKF